MKKSDKARLRGILEQLNHIRTTTDAIWVNTSSGSVESRNMAETGDLITVAMRRIDEVLK